MNKLVYLIALAGIALAAAWPVGACDSGTVRDAALTSERGSYRLCVFVRSDDAAAAAEIARIDSVLDVDASRLNVTVERVDVDAPAVEWDSYGIPGPPPETPVAALIGIGGFPRRAFVLDHWQPYPTDQDLATLKTSPVREKIKDGIASHWAVVLYSPGDASLGADGARPDDVFAAVEKEWAEKQSPGVTTVRFDRNDPFERMLRAFTGVDADGPAWAGVVFGRGKILAPPLTGSAITKEHLGQLLDNLAVPCTCLQESSVNGLDIPMTWDARLDAVVEALKPAGGYFETTLDAVGAVGGAPLPGAVGLPAAPPPLAPPPPRAGRRVLTLTIVAAAVLALLAVAATGVIVRRARRQSAGGD